MLIIFIFIFNYSVFAQENIDFNITIGDDENDVVEIVFSDDGFDLFKYSGKSYLDIKTAMSRLSDENITFTMELYKPYRDAENVYYEFFGWHNDSVDLWNYIISYSNHIANISYENNGTVIDITDRTIAQESIITFNIPVSYFLNATTFDFYAQAAERNPIGTRNNYFDTTEPIEMIAQEPIQWWLAGLGMLILFLIASIFFMFKRRGLKIKKKIDIGAKKCLNCGEYIRNEEKFCISCGKDFDDSTHP